MATAVPAGEDARPPTASHAAPTAGAAVARPTVRSRPLVGAVLVGGPVDGVAPQDEYVRRFWVAALGPGAVTDLLRLIAAGHAGTRIPRPLYLTALARAGLARSLADRVVVPQRIPLVPSHLLRRLPPGLREQHRRWMERRPVPRNAGPTRRPKPGGQV